MTMHKCMYFSININAFNIKLNFIQIEISVLKIRRVYSVRIIMWYTSNFFCESHRPNFPGFSDIISRYHFYPRV